MNPIVNILPCKSKCTIKLEQMSDQKRQRRDTESPDERAARLDRMSSRQQERLNTETPEEREVCLQAMTRLRHIVHEAHLPLLEQHAVQQKMLKYHQGMATIQTPMCSTCMERWPGMKVSARSSECQRCSRDKGAPKMYSGANNMDPGSVPLELEVIEIF